MTAQTVSVACKLPNGIYMQAYEMVTTQEPIMGGGYRDIQKAQPKGSAFKINGPNAPQGHVPQGYVDGGYVITNNVPKDIADAWFAANKDSMLVKNKIVFMSDKVENVTAQAKGLSSIKSGLERLDVTTKSENGREAPSDYRWPRSNNANVSGVKSDSK